SSRRRHTRLQGDWSSDVCSSDLLTVVVALAALVPLTGCPSSKVVKKKEHWSARRGEKIGQEALEETKEKKKMKQAEEAEEAPNRSEERRVGKECRCRGARRR